MTDKPIVWPDKLNRELVAILGLMNFETGPLAHIYQAAGEFVGDEGPLRTKTEIEQALILHKFIGYYLKHGIEGVNHMQRDIDRAAAIANTMTPAGSA